MPQGRLRYLRLSLALSISSLIYVAFLLWYGGHGTPLTEAEIQDGLARAGAAERAHGHPDNKVLREEVLTLLRSDDGNEFINVNLIRFRKHALYPAGSPFDDDPQKAIARYNASILPELLRRGGLPLYVGTVEGRFLHPEGAEDWDQVALVRYRSRRDLLAMAIALAEKDGDQHKWAAIEKTQVFPVRNGFNLFLVRASVGIFLYGFGLFLSWLVQKLRKRHSRVKAAAGSA